MHIYLARQRIFMRKIFPKLCLAHRDDDDEHERGAVGVAELLGLLGLGALAGADLKIQIKKILHLSIVFFSGEIYVRPTFVLQFSSLSLFFSASFMVLKRRMLRMTRETQGIRWTNRTRNLEYKKWGKNRVKFREVDGV